MKCADNKSQTQLDLIQRKNDDDMNFELLGNHAFKCILYILS